MHVSATEAKNRFGYLCHQAKNAPVFVEKAGRVETVILSAQAFEALSAAARFESRGVWCEDLRVW